MDKLLQEIVESGKAIKAMTDSDYISGTMRCEAEGCDEKEGNYFHTKREALNAVSRMKKSLKLRR